MPFSNFNYRSQWLELKDQRLEDIITYSKKFFQDFSEINSEQDTDWLGKAIDDWQPEVELPPGCKIIWLDSWITSNDRRLLFIEFVEFLSSKIESEISSTMPVYTERLVSECERIQKFLSDDAFLSITDAKN